MTCRLLAVIKQTLAVRLFISNRQCPAARPMSPLTTLLKRELGGHSKTLTMEEEATTESASANTLSLSAQAEPGTHNNPYLHSATIFIQGTLLPDLSSYSGNGRMARFRWTQVNNTHPVFSVNFSKQATEHELCDPSV